MERPDSTHFLWILQQTGEFKRSWSPNSLFRHPVKLGHISYILCMKTHRYLYIIFFYFFLLFFTIPVDPASLYLMQNDIFNAFKNPVIIYSALFCSRPIWLYFVCGTQNNMLLFWTSLTLILWTKEMQTFLKISSFVYTGFNYHNVHNATNDSFKNWNVLWGTQNSSSMQL